jgi:hypothetical protein
MNRSAWAAWAAFGLGAAAVAWVALGSAGSHPLAGAMTLAIGAVYAVGGVELWRFHRDTRALHGQLAVTTEEVVELPAWLDTLPATLRDAVRRRVEGERAGLPGPALTPYLVGLLVLLGMLGTFLGLVVTLDGTVLALERTTDLAAMRAALAAPVKGLGLAFGTSVAGVAASAMLGLVSALARRARADAVRALDRAIAGPLRGHGRDLQREARRSHDLGRVADALQAQSQHLSTLLPGVVEQVQALMARLDAQHTAQQAQLLAGQERFHREAQGQLTRLAESVGRDLRTSLAEASRVAGATLQPVAEATMAGIARESTALQARLEAANQARLDGLGARAEATVAALGDSLRSQAATLAAEVAQAHATLRADSEARDAERRSAWTQALQDLVATLQRQDAEARSQAETRMARLAGDLAQGTAALQQQVAAQADRTVGALAAQAQQMVDTVSTQTQRTADAVARLTETAAAAPRAAADVIAALRGQLSDSLQRDQALLAERSRLTEALQALISDAQRATAAQDAAVQGLVGTAEGLLRRTGDVLGAQLQAATQQQADTAVRLNAGAVEVASLGEAFGAAVAQFGANSGALVVQLGRIEAALDQSAARHDEQLAYYVAQAREVIDLSLSAQQPLVEALQRLAVPAAAADA